MANFYHKEKYALDYKNLQLYLRLEFELKIHRVLKFNKSE